MAVSHLIQTGKLRVIHGGHSSRPQEEAGIEQDPPLMSFLRSVLDVLLWFLLPSASQSFSCCGKDSASSRNHALLLQYKLGV